MAIISTDEFRKQFAELVTDMASKVKAEQRRAEWFAIKRGKIGASSVWVFYTPKLALANNKAMRDYIDLKAAECDGFIKPDIGGATLRHGNDEELPGAIDFIDRTGIVMTHYGEDQEWIAWPDNDQVGCTPDALIRCNVTLPGTDLELVGVLIVWEQKNNHTINAYLKFAAMESGEDLAVADYKYYLQIQHQMMVTGAVAGIFQARYTRHESGIAKMCWFIVKRNDEFIDQHGARMHQVINERDERRAVQSAQTSIDLNQFIKQ